MKPGSSICTITAPSAAPAKVQPIIAAMSRGFTSPPRVNFSAAEKDPKLDCSLLVASASAGDSPAHSSAGTVSSPPPPAMASTKPASIPTASRAASISTEKRSMSPG